MNTSDLLTAKQANYKSYFQKTKTQDLHLKSESLTCLHFFQIVLNCIICHLNKEILIDFEIKIFFHSLN